MRLLTCVAPLVLLSACAVEEPPTPIAIDPAEAYATLAALDEDAVGTAQAALDAEEWCALKCGAVFYLGCATVGGLCLTTDVLTVGAATIPCGWAIAAACIGIAGGGLAACIAACT